MLVLTRKILQKIIIAENIVVTVISIKGGRVKLGLEAPEEIPIVRQELLDDEKAA